MFSFPSSMAMTEESRVELEGPVAFVAAPVRASRDRSRTFVLVTQSDLADPRSFACVFSPVSARRTFEPRTIDWRSWETIAASPRCRDEASRAARDARTRLWNARLFRDEPFTYHVRKPEKIFPTVKSRVRGFSDRRNSAWRYRGDQCTPRRKRAVRARDSGGGADAKPRRGRAERRNGGY